MLKIGITGGIGSGKSTVCRIFEVLGVPVYSADQAAKRLMATDRKLIDGIAAAFGRASYTNGLLNRAYIARIVFNDPEQLELLNSIVHPAVFRDFAKWSRIQTAPYVAKEAALLFESGSWKLCDQTILVTAPASLKISRVMQRDGLSEEEVGRRMERQLSDEEKTRMADFVIANDERSLLTTQVLSLHRHFLSQVIV
jgi:dephospho-CoA kinase